MSGAADLVRVIRDMIRRETPSVESYARVVAIVAGEDQRGLVEVEFKGGARVRCSMSQTIQDRFESIGELTGREVTVLTGLVPPYVVDLVAGRGTISDADFG